MKNKFLYAALATIALATSCSNDGLIEDMPTNQQSFNDGRITFVQRTKNLTKAAKAETKGHYEFGVWAMKGASLAEYSATTNGVMGNYLVAYTDGTTSGINNWYQGVKANASTWGKNPSGDMTDAATGVSSWFYEGITSTNHATYTTPETNQILKYWDQAAANHYFFAYMPYTKNASAATTYNADQIAFSYDNTDGGKFVFTNLSSFYTTPVTGKQVTTAAGKTDKTYDDTELLNDNEALYTYKAVEKANYGQDVPLEFKHINAKVNIAFYEVIGGYKVKLIDVVPQSAVDANASITAVVPGVHFSPSTDNQGRQPMTVKQTTDLPTYYEVAEVTATHVEDANATLAVAGTTLASPKTKINPVNKNLVFAATNKTGQASVGGVTEYIGEASSANMTKSATTLYVLPNHNGTNYITDEQNDEFDDNGEASTHVSTTNVADQTGYTLHVSYQIIPEDGTAPTTVYDARVHVDAQYCKWQAGKAYTYIFKITSQTNGTTDPTKVDPASTSEPWIDPVDPRVPDDPALIPIVFDGVVVCDYDDAGDVEGNDHVITDIASWKSFGSTYRVSPATLTKAELGEMRSSTYNVVSPTTAGIVTPTNCSFNGETRKFTIGDGTNNVTWSASVQVATSSAPTYAPKYNSANITVDVPGAPVWSDYSLYVWEQNECTSATKYTVTPTGEVIYQKKTVVTKMKKTDDTDPKYKKEIYDASGTLTSTTWYNDENCTSTWTEDSEHTKNAGATTTYSEGVITYATPITVTTGATTATKAYAIVQ